MRNCCSSLRVWPLLLATLVVFFTPETRAQFTFAEDQASNYGGDGEPGWTNASNAGSGFDAWSFTVSPGSGFAGALLGDPSAAGVTGMSSESFGLFANPGGSGAYVFTDRSLSSVMQAGDTFSFQWGINFDSDNGLDGNKGFVLYTGAPGSGEVIRVNNGGNSDIQFNGVNTGFSYGTAVMNWTFTMTDATTVAVSANDRDGTGSFSTNITISGGLSSLRLYATNMGSGTERQPYYNNFLLTNSGVYNVATAQTESRYLTGSGNLAKTGNGTLTISGTTNNFTGTVGITNGAIRATASDALGSSTGVTVQSGAALEYAGGITVNRNLTINSTGVSGAGALRNISGNNIHSGTLTLGTASRIASDAGTLTISGAVSGSNVGLTVGGAGNTVVQTAIGIGSGRLTKESAGTLTLTANNSFTGNTLISGGALRLGNGGTTGAVTGTITNNGTLIYDRSDSITQSGIISGTGAVTKQGNGTLTLSSANTYSGTTTVSGGTVLADNSASLGTTAGGTTVEDGATLEISSSATLAENITITGNGVDGGGAIRSLGDGQNTLTGTITLGGNARIQAAQTTGSLTTLAVLGTNDFVIVPEYGTIEAGDYSQTATTWTMIYTPSLGLNNDASGTLGGEAGIDFSAFPNLGIIMSSASANTLGFTVQLFDSLGEVANVYSGSLSGIGASPMLNPLTLLSAGTGNMDAIIGMTFSWLNTGGVNTTLSSFVGIPTSGLTISGAIGGGANVLSLGAEGASGEVTGGNVLVSGVISGSGGNYGGTTTSLVKDGAGTLTLTGNNSFTGDIRVEQGTLAVTAGASTNALGVGADLFLSALGKLAVNGNVSVSSLQGAGNGDNGTVELANNNTLTVNGAGKTMTMAGNIIGTGALRLDGNSSTQLILTGDNTFDNGVSTAVNIAAGNAGPGWRRRQSGAASGR